MLCQLLEEFLLRICCGSGDDLQRRQYRACRERCDISHLASLSRVHRERGQRSVLASCDLRPEYKQ